jgi:hypothetical protein
MRREPGEQEANRNQGAPMLAHVNSVLWSVINFLRTYNGAVIAVATVFIGVFTFVLARITGRQAKLTRESIELARDEFLSSHRPEIIVHSVELAFDVVNGTDEATAGAQVIYVNKGRTPATVVDIRARITRRTFPLRTGIPIMDTVPVPGFKMPSGGKGYVRVTSKYRLEHERVVQQSEPSPRGFVVLMGVIVYTDARSARRETGFCRQLDAVGERWLPVGNPEYEYAY